MAEGDRQLAFTTGPLPSSLQVSGADKLTPKTVNASFDGTSAAGAFLPCLIITGRTGHEVARITAPKVAAGASAEVTWFPRVGDDGAAGDGGLQFGGIRHDYAPNNEGGWVYVRTNEHQDTLGPVGEAGAIIEDYTGKGVYLVSSDNNAPPLSQVFATKDQATLSGSGGTADSAEITAGGGFIDLVMGSPPVLVMRFNGGNVFLPLPSAAGPSGSLYKDAGGFVKVAP